LPSITAHDPLSGPVPHDESATQVSKMPADADNVTHASAPIIIFFIFPFCFVLL